MVTKGTVSGVDHQLPEPTFECTLCVQAKSVNACAVKYTNKLIHNKPQPKPSIFPTKYPERAEGVEH